MRGYQPDNSRRMNPGPLSPKRGTPLITAFSMGYPDCGLYSDVHKLTKRKNTRPEGGDMAGG
jgi:hypothetical protein